MIEVAARSPKQARSLVLSTTGLREQDTLRREFTQFTAAERVRSDRSRGRADRSARYAIAIGGIGLGGSLVLIALYAIYVSQPSAVASLIRQAAASIRETEGALT